MSTPQEAVFGEVCETPHHMVELCPPFLLGTHQQDLTYSEETLGPEESSTLSGACVLAGHRASMMKPAVLEKHSAGGERLFQTAQSEVCIPSVSTNAALKTPFLWHLDHSQWDVRL